MNTMRPLLILAAAFAAGAAAVVCLDRAAMRRCHSRTPAAEAARLRRRVQDEVASFGSYSDTIEVTVDNGLVRVSGYVLAAEMDGLLSQLTRVPGVHRVHNALSPVADPRRFDELRERALAKRNADDLLSQPYSGA
jgi:hypothetical protein